MRNSEDKSHSGVVRGLGTRRIVGRLVLIVGCLLVVAEPTPADCWVEPWICNEREIGCFHPNWMDSLDGSLLISEISIPGTHETMASQAGGRPVYCQSVQDLGLQLQAGIRALDIRGRHVHNKIAIYHATVYQEAWLGEPMDTPDHPNGGHQNVLGECVQFLYDNPSEFILMRIQHIWIDELKSFLEHECTRDFSETVEWYRDFDSCYISSASGDSLVAYKDFIWTGNSYLDGYPTVDETRGKIVLLQDFVTRNRVGNAPRRVISADFDNNGWADIAVVNRSDNNVCLLLNNADGSLVKKHFNTGAGPQDLCAADLDDDGWLDLAVVKFTNPGGNRAAILFNRGDGTGNFQDYVDYDVEDDPVGIAVTDVNRDDLPDLIITGQASSNITLLLNNAAHPGSFTRSDRVCGYGPRDVVSADFNLDGWPDLAVVKYAPGGDGHNYMALFIHNGVNTWYGYQDYYVEDDPTAITAADLNSDGLPDLVVAGVASSEISLLMNRAASPGVFDRDDRLCGYRPRDLVSADFNNDGWQDLALVKFHNPGSNYMAVFLNNASGVLLDYVDYTTADDPTGICAADLNLDGNVDLITTGLSDRRIEIFHGDGTGSFHSAHLGFPWSIIDLQDQYKMWCTAESFNNKWAMIAQQIDIARQGERETLYLNFISGSTHVDPIDVANGCAEAMQGMNQRTYNYLHSFLSDDPGHCGVILMDYPGPGLIEAVINQNDMELTSVDDDRDGALPLSFAIKQNYPNPFNPATRIEYSLPHRSQVTIEVFNLLGQKVRSLVESEQPAGLHTLRWDGTDDGGQVVSTGVYLYRFRAGDYVETRKMLLLK